MGWRLKGKPLAVQEAALKASYHKRGFAWFMEMGLGKSATALAEFMQLHAEGVVDNLVIVCPNSLKQNWVMEVDKWGLSESIHCEVWPEIDKEVSCGPFLTAINFEAFAAGYAKGVDYLEDVMVCFSTMLVIDESARLRNHNSKRTKALIQLSQQARVVRILSGQPVVRGAHDLYPQLRVLGAFSGLNYYSYRATYCQMGGFKGKQIVGSRNEAKLRSEIDPWIFRATKKEWLDLPEKIYQTRRVEMDPAQRKVYNEMRDDYLAQIDGKTVAVEMVITQMMKLQQISSGFLLHEGKAIVVGKRNPKLDELQDILEEVSGKTIVFAFYKHSVSLLKEALQDYSPAVLRGGMHHEEIEEAKRRFNEDDACKVLIAQITSSKEGHTLLGTESEPCATTIYYENVYDLDSRGQSEDRNHRIGQKNTVVYIDLVASPMDEKIVKALQEKKSVAAAIIDRE